MTQRDAVNLYELPARAPPLPTRYCKVKLVHSVHGMADIQTPHTAVVDTWHGYVDMLADRHNITAVGHPWCAVGRTWGLA